MGLVLFIDSCEICQRNKVRKEKNYGTLSLLGPAEKPFDIIPIDTLCGLDGYGSRHKYFHLAIDNFSRFIWGVSSRTQRPKDFKNLIEKVSITGKPRIVLADNFPSIRSNYFRSYLESQSIVLKFIPPDCHQSNGMIERANLTIAERIRCRYNEHEEKRIWTALAQQCLNEHNDSVHDSTKFSPRFLLVGESLYESNLPERISLDEARKQALINSKSKHDVNKDYYDRKHKRPTFEVGDLVLMRNGKWKKMKRKILWKKIH